METIQERPSSLSQPVQNNPTTSSSANREISSNTRTSRSGSQQPQTEADLRSKEQRRRERRERRAVRRQQHNYGHFRDPFTIYGSVYGANMPDILNTHMPPPPYSTLPHSASAGSRSSRNQGQPGPQLPEVRAVRSATARARRWRPLPALAGATTDLTRSQHFLAGDEPDPKSCCGVTVSQTVSIRWFIVMIAFVGICCSIVGTVLGAMKASGREHLTVSLLMIGVGIVLITVSGIAWRLTATDAPSCRAMLGLGGGCEEDYNNGRFLSRPQVSGTNNCAGQTVPVAGGAGGAGNSGGGPSSRTQHPYAAMMYSDFPYRPPPPSYQASMQEYRLRLLLLDRQSGIPPTSGPSLQQVAQAATEPPPNYRAHLRTAMLQALNHSRPPSYRSHVSDHPVIESATGTTNAGVTQPLNNNNNTANHQTLSSTSSNNHLNNNHRNSTTSTAAQNEQVQVAEVYAAPGSPESSQSVSVVLSNSRINSNNPAGVPNISNNQRSPGHTTSVISREIVGGQDISIVPVVSSHHRHDSVVFEGKTDLQEQYQYHVKSGNPADSSSKPAENGTELPGLYNHLFTTTQDQEKPSMVTIVQTSVTNSEPVIVTVSGSMEQGLNATSSDSGSDFSELRASPAEVQILATL